MADWGMLIGIGIILIIGGFLFLALGMISSIKEEKVKGGGIILVGPIPVVFGTDRRSVLIIILLAIALMLLAIIFLKN